MKHNEVVVWLDNDNDHVIKQAKTMERTIALYNEGIIVRRTTVSDPKHFTNEEIRRVSDGQH